MRRASRPVVKRRSIESLEARWLLHAGHDHGDGLEPLRVDAAATVPYTDSLGQVWSADTGFIGGGTDNKVFPVSGTNDPKLYTTRRAGEFRYSNPAADGDYTLNLLFSDWVTTAGTRKFNVSAEGQPILTNFDIAASGGGQKALIKSFNITVTGGMFDLQFTKVVGNPVLCGFELIPNGEPPAPTAPAAPSEATATANSASRITLKWRDNANNETAFEIERSNGDGFHSLAIVDPNVTTYIDEQALEPSTRYVYRIRAINGVGASGNSNLAEATTPSAEPPPPVPPAAILRVDAAGTKDFTDSVGNVWKKDANFTGGYANTGTYAVGGTTDDALFATRRTGDFSYSAAVPSGNYTLRLLFSDPYTTAGQRKFNVSAENQQILTNFDIIAAGGGQNALVKSFPVTITDGKLNLAFESVVGNAALSAFDLTPTGPVTNPPTDTFTKITWTQVKAAPIGRAEALHAVVDGKLYVFAGFSGNAGPVTRADVYDPATNTWSPLPDMPRRLTHAGTAVDGRNVYFAGGYIGTGNAYEQQFGTEEVWRFNVDSKQYTRMPDLPQNLAGGGLVVVGRSMHYFGGNDSARKDVAVHYVLNLDNPSEGWKSKKSLPTARSHMGYINLGGKIYAIAGQKGNDDKLVAQSVVEVYDSATDTWSTKKSMPKGINHISSSTFVMGGRIFTLGGQTSHNSPIADVYAYDPAADKWTALSPLPVARFSGVAGVINGTIIFTGGSSQTTTWTGTPG